MTTQTVPGPATSTAPGAGALMRGRRATEDDSVDAPVVFTQRPRPLLAEHRVSYRLATIVLVLSRFRSATASLRSLHLISWAIRTRRSRSMLLAWWGGRRFADTVTERLDPALSVTLNLAISHGLVRLLPAGQRLQLTEAGAELARTVDGSEALLVTEKAFLEELMPLNDARVARLSAWQGP